MIKPTETTTPSPAPEPNPAATPTTRRDELMKALEANPRFKMVKPSGQGFIIGAAQRPKGGG